MNKGGNVVLWVALAIVGAILVLGAGIGIKYVLTPKQPAQQVSVPASTSTQTEPTSQVSEDKTESWEMFRDEKLGFELQYPATWDKPIYKNPMVVYFKTQENIQPNFFTVSVVELGESFAAWSKKNLSTMPGCTTASSGTGPICGEELILGSLTGFTIKTCDGNRCFSQILAGNGNRAYYIDISLDEADTEEEQKLVIGILSTFKFI